MESIGNRIKKARLAKGKTIDELSQATKIRNHFIAAIENGESIPLPAIYVKGFEKTLCEYLEINDQAGFVSTAEIAPVSAQSPDNQHVSQKESKSPEKDEKVNPKKVGSTNENKPSKNDKKQKVSFDDDAPTDLSQSYKIADVPIVLLSPEPASTDYSDLFKNKKIKSGLNPVLLNYLVYAGVALAVIIIVYFTFFFDSKYFSSDANSSSNLKQDTAVVDDDKGLFEYFEKADTLTLAAQARDTAWLRIEIDGNFSEEILMLPGMNKSWAANEYFVVNQGNVGAIKFYRNGEQLEPFGRRGSAVKNIRITREEILGSSPWKEDPTTEFGTVETVPKETKRYTKKKKAEEPARIIEPSTIQPQKPSLLKNKPPN